MKKEKIAKDWTTDTATEQSGLELSSDDTDKARAHNMQNSNPFFKILLNFPIYQIYPIFHLIFLIFYSKF